MKIFKIINILSITLLLSLAGCKSEAEKNQEAIDGITKTQEELVKALEDAKVAEQNLITSDEWLQFKQAAQLQVAKNEADIEILRIQKSKTGRTFDTLYEKRINQLEADNNKLNQRLATFEKEQSNWEEFKIEFNNDIAALGKALENLTLDNSK